MLDGKHILVAVTGSIAAYKTAFFVRLLIKAGAEVRVIMTPSAKDFISPLTLATLSKHPVYSTYFNDTDGDWHNHVELALWADVMIIAPCSANTLAKLATGVCDNLLLATYLSAKCPVLVAPAMDLDMYRHPTTQTNLERIQSFGNMLVDAESGELASGLEGQGRMAEPETLFERIANVFQGPLNGKTIVITSGPTYEPLDPVRFIGNHSSGKMGDALALQAAHRGASVQLISGPGTNPPTHPNIHLHPVQTAEEMLAAAKAHFSGAHVAIFAAAVSDYRPAQRAEQKIKKKSEEMTMKLVKNPDIAATLGAQKNGVFTVGFALETENEEENALNKLKSKNFDLIVLNSLNDKGAGFGHNTNQVRIFDTKGWVESFSLKSKTEVANDILKEVEKRLEDK